VATTRCAETLLVINPGSTSTKLAVFEGTREVFTVTLDHSEADLAPFASSFEQLAFRTEHVMAALRENGYGKDAGGLAVGAVVGRGGMIAPIEPGGYLVDETLKDKILHGGILPHASNLGALIADAIAQPLGVPAYIYDAVGADEMMDVARVTGIPEVVRKPYSHVLNTRAMVRKYAESAGKTYADVDVIACHIGGGVSVNVHHKGRIIDSIEDDGGPFSMERAGVIPLSYVVDLAYSGEYTKAELSRRLRGMGGVKAHLGTHDLREVERRIAAGDAHALAIHDALAYQVAKGIGELSPVLSGRYDAIVLTGGAAYSEMLTEKIRARVAFIAPVHILPGENEMEALALGGLRILRGEEEAKRYPAG
jgi:butyrate kinase